MLSIMKSPYTEVIDNVLINFFFIKQKDKLLYKYVWKYKSAKEVTESHLGGPLGLETYIKTKPG